MGLFSFAQVNRKVNVSIAPPVEAPNTFSVSLAPLYESAIILDAALSSTDSIDHTYALSFVDSGGQATSLGTVVVPAPVAPADESVVSLSDPAGGVNLAGFVLPPGSTIYCRQMEAQVTGDREFTVTLGLA